MAEVIAIFAALSSFLQVVDFTTKLASHAHKLIISEKSSLVGNEETERLAGEYRSLATTSIVAIDDGPVTRLRRECQAEAQKLLEQLEALKVSPDSRGAKRIKEGTRKAVRALSARKDIDKRRHYLMELNSLLATALLQSLLAKHEEQVTKAMSLLSLHEQAGMNDHDKIGKLANYHKQRLQRMHQDILQSLHFGEMGTRENSIEKAYPKTYHWALEAESLGLRTWFRSGNGIFWVSGKAGSGKSTLMKFLSKSRETRRLLCEWCGSQQQLVFADFYFWFLGTSLQKSVLGLLRSILHQVLVERPDLGPIAFPTYFDEITEPENLRTLVGGHEELLEALYRIARHEEQSGSGEPRKKFCFFIDGLDEYHGNHLELVGLLRDLARNSEFKLCVSSRPWTAFRNAFEYNVPNLRLEDLTRPDIHFYVANRIRTAYVSLSGAADLPDKEITALREDIVGRAEGVFLRVFLVAKSVLDGLTEGDDIKFLRHRVQTFPSDLEEFFKNILVRVDPVYRHQSNQALKLALNFALEAGPAQKLSSWIDYWLIKQNPYGLVDPRFAYDLEILQVTAETLEKMVLETRSFLNAVCKDLLCIPNQDSAEQYDPAAPDGSSVQVQFLHRTVYDFLQTEDIQNALHTHVPHHFKDTRIFHLLNLARLKVILDVPYGRSNGTICNFLERTAAMSITVTHSDLCKEYVGHFDAVALEYRRSICYRGLGNSRYSDLFLEPKLLAALAAFQTSEYVLDILSDPDNTIPGLRLILAATLGENPLNIFGLAKVDLSTIEFFLDRDIHLIDRLYDICNYYFWQGFFRKFSLSTELLNHSSSSDLRHVWEIATLFLRRGVSTEGVFCSKPKHPTSMDWLDLEHTTETVADFLKKHIPHEWRIDYGDQRLIDQ